MWTLVRTDRTVWGTVPHNVTTTGYSWFNFKGFDARRCRAHCASVTSVAGK